MARDIFVDTSGFYALLVKRDDRHEDAAGILREARASQRGFVTTDYVLDETATLLKARSHGHLLAAFFETLATSKICRIEWTDSARFGAVQGFFLKHIDHAWSFTDCLSFQVMKESRLREALTKDARFAEAGFVPLLTD
jgi:predicted nucleic acid-binding protein